jgi:glycosyltransferase involved in cell wall biosynthesis
MEHYWTLLAGALQDRHRRSVLVYPESGAVPEAIARAPIEVRYLDFGDRSEAGWERIRELVLRERVSSVYLTDRPYSDLRYLRLRSLGVRSIAVHDHTPGGRPPVRGLKGWLKARQRELPGVSADLFVAVSDFVRDRMIENARVPAPRTVVVPNGVVSWEYHPEDRAWGRREIGAADGEIVIGMVARAHRIKGIDCAIRAAASMVTTSPNTLFAFVGDGPDLDYFRRLAAEAGVAARFRFLGHRADARRLMAAFDIGLHPSTAEVGYSLAILEMMNAGLPVVVPDEPSVRGATEPAITGAWYRAGDCEHLACQLARLAGDPASRRAMGEASRERTLTRFSLDEADRAFLAGVASRL